MEHPNPYVSCPFNTAHQVPKLRLQHHLVKCRKNYVDASHAICPFNATHIIAKPGYLQHLQNCPERKLIEAEKYNVTLMEDHGHLGNPTFHMDLPTEEWDEESDDLSNTSASESGNESPHNQPLGRCYRNRDSVTRPLRLPKQVPIFAKKSQVETVSEAKVRLQKDWMGMGRGSVHKIIAESMARSSVS